MATNVIDDVEYDADDEDGECHGAECEGDDDCADDDDGLAVFPGGKRLPGTSLAARTANPSPPSAQRKSQRHAMCSKPRSIPGRTSATYDKFSPVVKASVVQPVMSSRHGSRHEEASRSGRARRFLCGANKSDRQMAVPGKLRSVATAG